MKPAGWHLVGHGLYALALTNFKTVLEGPFH